MSLIPKIGFVSLGCPKALVDSEHIITRLRTEGYDIAESYQGADLVVVNTCGFIDAAVEESLNAIGEALAENGKVIVTGCLGARGSMVTDAHPSVLAVTGPHAADEVLQHVHTYLPKPHDPFMDLVPPTGIKLTPRHYAYLKISEGCNHSCTFCIIPRLRGRLISRPVHEVLIEAEQLVRTGVKELLIVSQDTSAYGLDIKYRSGFHHGRPVKTRLTELCEELSKLGIWIRLHYVYPYPSADELIPLMAHRKILPYLDIPFQHASQSVLKAMKRPANNEDTLKRILQWRQICPELVLRSTFIVGFPGETEKDVEILLDFLQKAQLDNVGCFTYSPVEGAKANELPGALPEEVKTERLDRVMALQAQISAERLQKKIGQSMTVLVDEVDHDENGLVCRSIAQAPQVDGVIYVPESHNIVVGDLINIKITDSDEYDLWGEHV